MKYLIVLAGIALMTACEPSAQQSEKDKKEDAAAGFTPAIPAGKIAVSFALDQDTQRVKIRFEVEQLSKEKDFELPLAQDVRDADLYRTVWDKPNSCYIGVLKQDHTSRYYHASQEGNDLKINQVGTPPAAIWQYAENTLGLGKIQVEEELTEHYQRNFQSGQIIADLIVSVKPAATKDSVRLYTEFGGARKTISIAAPEGYEAAIRATDKPDHCIFGFTKDNKFDGVMDIQVQNGRLQVTELKRVQ